MSTRNSRRIKAAVSVILSSMFVQGLVTGNYVVSVIVLVVAATILGMLGLRAHRTSDEREKSVAGTAALTTVVTFSVVSVFVSFWLLVTKGQDPLFRISAFVLAYAASFIMLCFGFIYSLLNEAVSPSKKYAYIIFSVAIAVFFVLYGIHAF